MLTNNREEALKKLCRKMRYDVISQLHRAGTGHAGGSLSACEILVALYFEEASVNPQNPQDPARDRIVLCKGHGAPMLYRVLAEKGFFDVSEFAALRQYGSRLQGHPNALETPGVEISTGPLGLGLSAALGKALAIRGNASSADANVFAILGDGELDEGTVWEAAMSAAKFGADHLIAIVDNNGVQLDGTNDTVMPLLDLRAKWEAFGWNVYSCDGHDLAAICRTIEDARSYNGRPSVILAKTVKGKGVSFMEGNHAWHGGVITDAFYEKARLELMEDEKQ